MTGRIIMREWHLGFQLDVLSLEDGDLLQCSLQLLKFKQKNRRPGLRWLATLANVRKLLTLRGRYTKDQVA